MTETPANSLPSASLSQGGLDRFLVCGLGSVGQHCVAALTAFEVSVSAIEEVAPAKWEIPNLPALLDDLIIGDCSQISVLKQAKIEDFRAVLLVTGSERVNAETALAVRKLNPHIRLVVRSAKENLNQLLSQHLGNFVAFEPTQLPAAAFALAALGSEISGFFKIDGHWLRVVKRQLSPSDRWCDRRFLYDLNSRTRRVLCHTPNSDQPSPSFHEWEPDAIVRAGDTIVYLEIGEPSASHSQKSARETKRNRGSALAALKSPLWRNLKQKLAHLWEGIARDQTSRVATVSAITLLTLMILGTILFKLNYPDKTHLKDAVNLAVVLLLGGFDNVFGALTMPFPISWGLYLFCIILTVAGTVFTGIVYAMLTEKVLTSRFQFLKQRPPIPQQDHVVVIGLGRLSQRVADLLQEFNQPLAGITPNSDFDMTVLPKMPLIVGNFKEALEKVNLSTAKSVIVDTDDEMLNLELGLMARAANPNLHLAIRTFEQRLSDDLAELIPNAQLLCAYALAAEVFAGAAFGENIISLFRLNHQTVLVTEYTIEANDTLNGLLLAQVAYGYGVVPICHQKRGQESKLMPSEDTLLTVGDRMVVLATINGLRRIERGEVSIAPRLWLVLVDQALTQDAAFEGGNLITRISGCSLSTARDLMENLPGILQLPLYKHQAQRLVRELNKNQVMARAVPIFSKTGNGSHQVGIDSIFSG
jgi:Trk K+ transport system NAD-binding subunit